FAVLNEELLQAHARARRNACDALASSRLVIRYSFGTLEARWKGEVFHKAFVLPREYHPLKDISHAVLLVAFLFAEPPGEERSLRARRAAGSVQGILEELGSSSSTAALIPRELVPAQQRLLKRTQEALGALANGDPGAAERQRYFADVRD